MSKRVILAKVMKQALKSGHFYYDTLNTKPRTLFYLNFSKTGRGCHDGYRRKIITNPLTKI